jgi:hypothetical protein
MLFSVVAKALCVIETTLVDCEMIKVVLAIKQVDIEIRKKEAFTTRARRSKVKNLEVLEGGKSESRVEVSSTD